MVRRLLFFVIPLSWGAAAFHAPPVPLFVLACVAVLPLAALMGEATERLAEHSGPTLGGLLNATFGNAAELLIALVALRAGLVELVKASITGSILGNLLLILGLSLVAAGLRRPTFTFNRVAAGMSAGMLGLAVAGLSFPAVFHALHPNAGPAEVRMSELVAIVLGVTYLFSLLFSLRTHQALFGGAHPVEGRPQWTVRKAVLILALATAGVAVESEILVHATESVAATLGWTQTFLGLIVIPLIGNAAEHATAIVVARKGQIDLALHVALGSSTQVALFVTPVLVFASLLMGQPMNLVFPPFQVVSVALSTAIVAMIMLDGESHWFEGVQLLAVYTLVAVAGYFI